MDFCIPRLYGVVVGIVTNHRPTPRRRTSCRKIHQQLDTSKKLFCKCRPVESDEYTEKFSRSLRTAKSELGKLDPAALFEKTKSKKINYYANSQSSCLVEKDEEPPHDLDHNAKKISLLISSMLESKIFSEIHVMRKTVIDGSNTSGFQRTMLVSQGGNLKVGKKKDWGSGSLS